MGAESFVCTSCGVDAKEAFKFAVEQAQYDHGHAGYTGTIAEKDAFVMLKYPGNLEAVKCGNENPRNLAYQHCDDAEVQDKWGPAGCWDVGITLQGETRHTFVFFGWASS